MTNYHLNNGYTRMNHFVSVHPFISTPINSQSMIIYSSIYRVHTKSFISTSFKRRSGEIDEVRGCCKMIVNGKIHWLSNHLRHLHHHHDVGLVARISLTLSRHSSLSFIALGRSSGQHPVSSHSCWMYVRAGRPTFAHPYVGVHRSTSLMSSSLLLQQCPACLVRLTCIVFVMGGKCPYSWSLVGCCRQDLFNTALNILV